MGFLRQKYWSGLPFPSPGDLSNTGFEPVSHALQEDSLPLSHQSYKEILPTDFFGKDLDSAIYF